MSRIGHRRLTSVFSGLFIGTYSAVPYAALCRVVPRTRHVRCGFAIESPVDMAAHGAARGMPYAGALLKRLGLDVGQAPHFSHPDDRDALGVVGGHGRSGFRFSIRCGSCR